MKTNLKSGFYLLTLPVILASCMGKSGSGASSGAAATSDPTTTQTAKTGSVIDSLQITDPAEVKLCNLYDNAVTEYMKRVNEALTDTAKLNSKENLDIDKKFKEESDKLQPEIKNLEATLRTNPVELMKFEKFSMYESQRVMGVASQFAKIKMAQMPK